MARARARAAALDRALDDLADRDVDAVVADLIDKFGR